MPYMQVFAHFLKKNEVFVVKNLEIQEKSIIFALSLISAPFFRATINLFLVLSFLSG